MGEQEGNGKNCRFICTAIDHAEIKSPQLDIMTHSFTGEDEQLQITIQQSLQEMAEQMGHGINERTSRQLYQESVELLSHISYAPITLARVAGTLLVYQVQQAMEPEELEWFKTQVQQCPDDAEVEELIESMHRTDAL